MGTQSNQTKTIILVDSVGDAIANNATAASNANDVIDNAANVGVNGSDDVADNVSDVATNNGGNGATDDTGNLAPICAWKREENQQQKLGKSGIRQGHFR